MRQHTDMQYTDGGGVGDTFLAKKRKNAECAAGQRVMVRQ